MDGPCSREPPPLPAFDADRGPRARRGIHDVVRRSLTGLAEVGGQVDAGSLEQLEDSAHAQRLQDGLLVLWNLFHLLQHTR